MAPGGRRSGRQVVLGQPALGVDRFAVTRVHLEEEVRAGDAASGADVPDEVTGSHSLAELDAEITLVAVPQDHAVVEAHDGLVAEGAVVGGLGDDPGADGTDLGPSEAAKSSPVWVLDHTSLEAPNRPVRW